ncbi:hypothetical protein BU15DRAFT_59823 [Melanogaster broomeanus]|nr:hypothetical protein BU15DRAFT_59823 [Melanogaster broomeanus]
MNLPRIEHQPSKCLSRTSSSPTSIILDYVQGLSFPLTTVIMAGTPTSPVSGGIDVLVAGQTGAGKSFLINMIMGVEDSATISAKVSGDVRPCTEKTTSYTTILGDNGLQCYLWDTRGVNEALHNAAFMATVRTWLRQAIGVLSECERDLKNACKASATHGKTPIFLWCMVASQINVPFRWQQFRKAYAEYCGRKVTPVVVITRMRPNIESTDWRKTCKDQLRNLDFGTGSGNADDFHLVKVRERRSTSSTQYNEDSEALRDLLTQLSALKPIRKMKLVLKFKRRVAMPQLI